MVRPAGFSWTDHAFDRGTSSESAGAALLAVRVLEVAVARALHDGLRALELELGVVALAERAVAVARQQMADLAQPHRLVGLGVAALHDVEAEARLALFRHLDLERAPLG